MYQDFAYIYDKLQENINYKKWTDYIEGLFKKYGLKPVTIADVACGTGSITLNLAKRGYDVTGIDISEDMLYVAKEKSRKEGYSIPFICQDMVDLTLHNQVDAVTCMCDGVNYINGEEEVAQFFSRVHAILKPGGIFIFDISSYYKLNSVLGNRTIADNDEEISLIWNNYFEKETSLLYMDLTFFVEKNGFYKRIDEEHIQRAYHADEIVGILQRAGFKNVDFYGPFCHEKPKKRSQRIFFAAIK